MKKFWIFLLSWAGLYAQIDSNGDFQIWNREVIRQHFDSRWSWYLMSECRFGDNASKLFYTFLQVQGIYKPASWVAIAAGYRQGIRRFPFTGNQWKFEYSPLVDVTFVAKTHGWEFVNRNRCQYIIFQSDPSHWQYRNRFRIITPWSFSKFRITPFVDNEWFFMERHGYNQDRLCGGLMMLLRGNLSGQLYYMARFLKEDLPKTHWVHQNVLNITLLLAY